VGFLISLYVASSTSPYAAAPHAAPAASVVPPTIGLVQQASSLGQFAGPALLGLWVEHFGWQAAPAILAPVALLGLASAFALRRIRHRRTARPQRTTGTSPRVAIPVIERIV
jgi:MFS family permease